MDIRNWSLDRIMQLPDSCLSRRFLISCCCAPEAEQTVWDISELGLPERAVLWEMMLWANTSAVNIESIRIALGDQLPASTEMMDALEPLIYGLGLQGPEPRVMYTSYLGMISFRRLRIPIEAAGRRLVLEVTAPAGQTPIVLVGIVVSTIPTEVPDWLISGSGRSL